MHEDEIILENKLIEDYFANKDTLSKSKIQEFYNLYDSDFLFKERADKYNLEKKSTGKQDSKYTNVKTLFFSVAASVTVLLMFSVYYLNKQSEFNNEIAIRTNSISKLENTIFAKDDSIKHLFVKNKQAATELNELKRAFTELKQNSNIKKSEKQQLAMLIHYKNKVNKGAFIPNQNFAYKTKGNDDDNIMISPLENEMLLINQPVVFKWKYDKNISELRIYNNQKNTDPIKIIKINSSSSYTYTKRLDFGTYYWKLKYSTSQKAKTGSFQVHF